MKYALQIEKELTKEEILERYLNIAPFGNGAYGIFAASQVYFGKQPKDLTIAEAALLAGMVKAPSAFDPTTADRLPAGARPAQLRHRQHGGDRRDHRRSRPTQGQGDQARRQGQAGAATAASRSTKNNWGFFCDYFYRWWLSQEAFGATTYDRERRLKSGGYRDRDLAGRQGAGRGAKNSRRADAQDRNNNATR